MTDSLVPAQTALLVMDVQPGIVGMLSEPEPLLDRAAEAIALVRERGGEVGYVRVAFTRAEIEKLPPGGAMAARAAQAGDGFLADSPLTQVHARLAPERKDIVVRKTRVGAFSTTDLEQQLHARGITTLVLAGISTSGVVLSTVRDASDRDYRLVVLSDACADPQPDVHAFLTERIFPRQATVMTVAELGEQLA